MTVLVSCVEENPPFRNHAHKLVGKGSSEGGICKVKVKPEDDMTYEFETLKLQCVRKVDYENELRNRQEINVDPFENGFSHKSKSGNSIRLCFQVVPEVPAAPIDIPPEISQVIRHDKTNGELTIVHYSEDKSTVEGGQKTILLLSSKVSKNVEVHFNFQNPSK